MIRDSSRLFEINFREPLLALAAVGLTLVSAVAVYILAAGSDRDVNRSSDDLRRGSAGRQGFGTKLLDPRQGATSLTRLGEV
jgi:hypothetical protein